MIDDNFGNRINPFNQGKYPAKPKQPKQKEDYIDLQLMYKRLKAQLDLIKGCVMRIEDEIRKRKS